VVRDTVWPLQPHTAAKHRILRCYLDAWLPIMGSWNGRILILDGFAGPGIYTGGEEGSPIIALRALLEHRHMAKHLGSGLEVRFHFVEEDAARVAVLKEQIDKFKATTSLPKGVHVKVAKGEFAPYLDHVLTGLESAKKTIAPTFAFIDPFGFSGVPMQLMARLAKNPRCEVLISFMFESLNRFAGRQPKIEAHLDALYGTTAWRPIAADTDAVLRRRGLIDLYRQQLVASGFPLVTSFEMIDDGNRTEYFLYFGTTSRTGLSAMKQAMWKGGPRRRHVVLRPHRAQRTVVARSRDCASSDTARRPHWSVQWEARRHRAHRGLRAEGDDLLGEEPSEASDAQTPGAREEDRGAPAEGEARDPRPVPARDVHQLLTPLNTKPASL
jgi:three-Cys-motif partner protein